MADKCPDCDRPFATGIRSYRWGGACGLQLSRSEHNDTTELELNCATVTVANLRTKLSASEAECERLRREVEVWKELSSKACETPADGCECAGCARAAVEHLKAKESKA